MTKAEILALVASLAIQPLDADPLDVYFGESLEDMGKRSKPPLVGTQLFDVTAGTADYTLSSDAVRMLAVFIGGVQLSAATIGDLEAYSAVWRTLTGTPFAYTTEHVNARTFTLVPNPTVTSDALIPTHGAPYGEDFPANGGCQVFSQTRETDLPDWIALCLAIDILSREYARPSLHQDTAFSALCARVSDLLYRLGGMS